MINVLFENKIYSHILLIFILVSNNLQEAAVAKCLTKEVFNH